VTEIERLAGDRREAGTVLDETLEHPDATLGRRSSGLIRASQGGPYNMAWPPVTGTTAPEM
jgi:hypothetical protein